jgi:hypothetical protein
MTIAATDDSDRHDLLNEIALRWSKFSKRDLIEITTNDDLISALVDRYGIKRKAAQREVDMMMDGRNLGP